MLSIEEGASFAPLTSGGSVPQPEKDDSGSSATRWLWRHMTSGAHGVRCTRARRSKHPNLDEGRGRKHVCCRRGRHLYEIPIKTPWHPPRIYMRSRHMMAKCMSLLVKLKSARPPWTARRTASALL